MEITNEAEYSTQIKEHSLTRANSNWGKQCRNCENTIIDQSNSCIEENTSRLGLTPPDEVCFNF